MAQRLRADAGPAGTDRSPVLVFLQGGPDPQGLYALATTGSGWSGPRSLRSDCNWACFCRPSLATAPRGYWSSSGITTCYSYGSSASTRTVSSGIRPRSPVHGRGPIVPEAP